MDLFKELTDKIVEKNIRIVFPEATDQRILGAVTRLAQENVLQPILIGQADEISERASNLGYEIEGIEILDPNHYEAYDELVHSFVERRKGKANVEDSQKILRDPVYFATMLVYTDRADGLVAGAVYSTGDTVRPALQIIKTRPGVNRTSGAFLMLRNGGKERYIFADCAINPQIDENILAEIAGESATTAKIFNIDPKVAMLSFSTKGSADGDQVKLVQDAFSMAQEKYPDLKIDGELQFDAAISETVGQHKAPDSPVAGQANVFVFPDLQSGNIGYKIAQRLGGFEAVGPILQGLNKPISDLSRGCVEEDIYKTAIITANQVLLNQ